MTKTKDAHLEKLREQIWEEFLERVEELYRQNYTIRQMARILNCDESHVHKALAEI